MPLLSRKPRIGYFVSSHGFGHAARTRTILKELQGLAAVTVYSTAPHWFWGDLSVRHERYQADIGCIQKETLTIDEHATCYAYRAFQSEKHRRFDEVSRYHYATPFDGIVSDIAPEPLEFANLLGIKSLLVANFTWLEIYEPMPAMSPVMPELERQYSQADVVCIPGLRTGMTWAKTAFHVDPVAELGSCIREKLNPKTRYTKVIYIDAGRWGADISWHNAANYVNTLFVRIGTRLEHLPENVLQLEFGDVRHADLVKSVDLVVSKPGYGIVTECLANGTPWGCIPRRGFAEDDVLIQAAADANLVKMVDANQLKSLDFHCMCKNQHSSELHFDGAKQIAAHVLTSLTS